MLIILKGATKMSKFSLSNIGNKRAKKGLRKQIISIFSIIADKMGPQVDSVASPYESAPIFNEREISILFTAVTMLDIHEMLMGELKLIFEIMDYTMSDGRPSKKIFVVVCGCEAVSSQVRTMARNLILSSDVAIKNLENIMER